MKWIVSLLVFAIVVFMLKETEPRRPQNLIQESVAVLSLNCEDVWRTSNMLNIGLRLKSGEYLFKTQLKDTDCEQFNKRVKIGCLVSVTYFPAGYNRFSLVSIAIDGQVWVQQ